MNHCRTMRKPLAVLMLSALAQYAAASGYHFGTQSVTAQSTANSSAAEAGDASALFYNAAGLTKLDKPQITAAFNIVMPSIRYRNAQAAYLSGEPVSGSRSGKITPDAVVAPHLYGAYPINNRITAGLGVYVPFASSTEYQKDSVLRHNINQLGLTSVAIEPALAFKVDEKHSFGAGVVVQHSKAKLRKYADWSAAIPSADLPLPALGGKTLNQLGGRPALEAHAQMEGSDWGTGYRLSWLYDINDRARIGANYRSKITHNLKGKAEWHADGALAAMQVKAGQAAQRGYPAKEDASVKIVTPESLSLHGMFKANDQTHLFGDITYTRHSRFNKAEVKFATPKTIGANKTADRTVIRPNWRNTFKVSAGAAYRLNPAIQIRGGIGFDQSPVRSVETRLNTLPDGNRTWFSAGVKYTPSPNHELDAAYSHIRIQNTAFKGAAASGSDVDSKGTSSASFKNHADIVGVQYSYKF